MKISSKTKFLTGGVVLLLSLGLIGVAAAQPAPGHFLVILEEGVDARSAADDLARTHGVRIGLVFDAVLNGFSFTGPPDSAGAVEKDDRVRVVAEDRYVQALEHHRDWHNGGGGNGDATPTPTPPSADTEVLPADIDRIEADQNTTNTGVGIKIGILDTGIDLDHPDLNVDPNCSETFATGGKDASDKNGHGTHVAGTAAALDNSISVVGVALGATLCAVKVLDNGGGARYSWLIAGLNYAVTNNIDVVNMS